MREIKFRAWDTKKKKFDYDVMILRGEACYIDSFDNLEFYEEGRMIILQYTGLKDKNGKEIYEGDIIRNVSGQRKYIVTWDEKEAYFYGEMIGVKDSNFIDWKNFEIIGNIYEFPKEVTP